MDWWAQIIDVRSDRNRTQTSRQVQHRSATSQLSSHHHHLPPTFFSYTFDIVVVVAGMSASLQQASASPMPEGVTDPNYKPQPGRLGNLTVEQQHILDKFRKTIQEEGWFVPERMDDATLLRYASMSPHIGRNVLDTLAVIECSNRRV